MVVNASKTELMQVGKGDQISITADGQTLRSGESMKVLGVMFDKNLHWDEQVAMSVRNCQRMMRPALRRLRTKLSTREFAQVITLHYLPRLYYASEVWFNCLSCKLKKTNCFNPLFWPQTPRR